MVLFLYPLEEDMRNRHDGRSRPLAIASVGLLGLWAGCIDQSAGPGTPPSPGEMECGETSDFDRRNFSAPTRIDNRWFPLVPGTQFILDGVANRGGGLLAHRVVFTVTDLTKEIDGVDAVVLWDRDYNGGVLSEAELAFFAQDDEGNVWSLGEYPEEYEHGEFVGAPSTWIAGLAGADAGLHMLAEPLIGTRYLQGWAPEINFLDCAMVFMSNQSTCVPYNCYENVLITDERSPLEVGTGHQRKYYAPSVGVVQVGAVGDDENETLVLTNLLQLSPQVLAEAREAALKLEKRAYQVSAVYRSTAPLR